MIDKTGTYWDDPRDASGRFCTSQAYEKRTGLITSGSHPKNIDGGWDISLTPEICNHDLATLWREVFINDL